jgi:hypothetical protein
MWSSCCASSTAVDVAADPPPATVIETTNDGRSSTDARSTTRALERWDSAASAHGRGETMGDKDVDDGARARARRGANGARCSGRDATAVGSSAVASAEAVRPSSLMRSSSARESRKSVVWAAEVETTMGRATLAGAAVTRARGVRGGGAGAAAVSTGRRAVTASGGGGGGGGGGASWARAADSAAAASTAGARSANRSSSNNTMRGGGEFAPPLSEDIFRVSVNRRELRRYNSM